MSTFLDSGVSTPTVVVSSPSSPRLKGRNESYADTIYNNPRIPASTIVEFISSRPSSTSAVYLYDLAEQAGFGTITKEWATSKTDAAPVIELQTRAGAGLSLVGRLSEGTSQETSKGAVLTAYTTPAGLALMAPSLAHLPSANPSSRLTVQVAGIASVTDSLAFIPSLSALASSWSLLPENTIVLLSSTPQQTADFAALSYKLTKAHVIHIFDQYSSARELGHQIKPNVDEATYETVGSAIANAGYKLFDYIGDANAQTVLVLLNGPLALSVASLVKKSSDVGVLIVNVLRPWDELAFVNSLPANATTVHVFDDVPNASTQGSLYADVLGSVIVAKPGITTREHRIVPTKTQELLRGSDALTQFLESVVSFPISHPVSTASKKVLTISDPENPLLQALRLNESLFFAKKGVVARSLSDFDGFSLQGGLTVNRLLLSSTPDTTPIPLSLPLDSHAEGAVDVVAVLDQALLKSHAVLQYAKPGSPVLVATNWTAEEFVANIAPQALHAIQSNGLHVFTINPESTIAKVPGIDDATRKLAASILIHFAFLRLYLGKAATEDNVITLAQASLGAPPDEVSLKILNSLAWTALEEIVLTDNVQAADNDQPLRTFSANAIAVDSETGETVVNGARLASWHDAAKHVLFPSVFTPDTESSEEYPQIPSLHPENPDRTFLVTCTVNRRLTPLEYDRNVFHLEFDTSGTGLKYAIGEALGVHGWNDEQEVLGFCEWYGVDPSKLVTIPVPGGDGLSHTRTVFQALQQQIDLFGHPPKSFYTDLAPYATSSVDRHALLFIGAAEGSATYKKLSEKDTVTFADILAKYSTARPPIEKLCELVGDIKPRHYSIASSQSVVGDRVDLLVVTVEWLTPSGSPRFGQCTRYLAGLKPGQKVTVSIKPSVMKLPPSPEQPIILAGLGTGAAPFRAFFQHLAWLSAQGQKIGPVYYYFGSRHQASEYLYGEEIEAYIQDGVITRAGLAFSRDGPKKVYIQHKMLEDSKQLVDMLYDQKGVFYLCGPTWPVPDVYEALINSLVNYKGVEPTKAADYLEGLKEEERYVLEVY